MRIFIIAALTSTACLAHATTFTVNATDNIYGAGQSTAPGGGTVPNAVLRLSALGKCISITKIIGSLACASKQGCIELNNGSGNTPNDAYGTYAAPATSSNTGAGSISGITAPKAGYLVGVFTKIGAPSGAPPAALDFTTGAGTTFTTLAPALNQTFFMGDGRTGDGKGVRQGFVVPDGAKRLYLGISDACNYNGSPSCYDDNIGTFTVSISASRSACSTAP
jgi:hypothetical protein